MSALDVRRVGKTYRARPGGREVEALRAIDLAVPAGEFVALVGASGSGKSTLTRLIGGLDVPTRGEISVGGRPVRGPGRDRGFVFQADRLFPWRTVLDNVAFGLLAQGTPRRAARAAAAAVVERVGLAGFEAAYPHELSGGMRQRVAFARTVLAGKPVMLLDEPFGGLDAITRAEMQEWLASALAAEPRTVVLVTHDVEEALYLCDRVTVLSSRPARLVAELRSPAPRATPRTETVTSPEFSSVRERAMRALSEGAR
jgi:NitT/TauT family transport system ATP-binding protein